MPHTIYSDIVNAEPDTIKAYIDGLVGTTLYSVNIKIFGQKALVVVDKEAPP
jgi:hypothetical protein